MSKKWLNKEELINLLMVAKKRTVRDEVLILLSYRHGLRREEATLLKWGDLDLGNATIHITRVKGSNSGTHPLQSDEVKLLKRLRKEGKGQFLFPSLKGGAISPNRVSVIAKDIGKEAGLENFHHHSLRHTCGYMMAEQGINPLVIKNWLGHKNLQNTMIYVEGACTQFNSLPKWW